MQCGAGAAQPEITIIGSQACKQAKATAGREEKGGGRRRAREGVRYSHFTQAKTMAVREAARWGGKGCQRRSLKRTEILQMQT